MGLKWASKTFGGRRPLIPPVGAPSLAMRCGPNEVLQVAELSCHSNPPCQLSPVSWKASSMRPGTDDRHWPSNMSSVCTYTATEAGHFLNAKRLHGDGPCLQIRHELLPGPSPRELSDANRSCSSSNASHRVAVCLAGAARTFGLPHVHQSIAKQLVRGLKHGTRADSAVDVFAVLDLGDRTWGMRASERRVAEGLGLLQPRAVARWRDGCEKAKFNKECSFRNGSWLRTPANLLRSLAQPATWGVCLSLIEAHEAAVGVKYDWIVRTRPDLLNGPWVTVAALMSGTGLAFRGDFGGDVCH